jgi:hypothetical protein
MFQVGLFFQATPEALLRNNSVDRGPDDLLLLFSQVAVGVGGDLGKGVIQMRPTATLLQAVGAVSRTTACCVDMVCSR